MQFSKATTYRQMAIQKQAAALVSLGCLSSGFAVRVLLGKVQAGSDEGN